MAHPQIAHNHNNSFYKVWCFIGLAPRGPYKHVSLQISCPLVHSNMKYHAYNIQNTPNVAILRKTAFKFKLHINGKMYEDKCIIFPNNVSSIEI